MTNRDIRRLRARIDANCCEIHGLTDAQMKRHKHQIAQTILKAKQRAGV